MKKNSNNVTLNEIQTHVQNFQKDFSEIKNKSSIYLKNNTEKEFLDLSQEIKKMEYNQLVFPKKIRNQKSFKIIRKLSKALSKIERDLRAYDLIDKEILSKKGSGADQNYVKSFENTITIRRQNLLSKSNKMIRDVETIDIPVIDNNQFNEKSLQKRSKKLSSTVDKLTKEIGKKVIKLDSYDSKNIIVPIDYDISNDILKLQKRCEKLKFILDTMTHLPNQTDMRGSGNQSSDNLVIKNFSKIHKILQDISSINIATSMLKQAGSEHYLNKALDKINDDLQDKQKQFIETCRIFLPATSPTTLNELKSNNPQKSV
jgi:hypothetical protein